MKRMIAFFIVFIFLIAINFIPKNCVNFSNFEKLIVISSQENFDSDFVKNDNHFYYTFEKEEGKQLLKNIDFGEIQGLVFYYSKDKLSYLLKNVDFYYQGQDVEGMKVYYGYDNAFPNFNYIDGKKFNFQIVEKSTEIVLGYPMILCGY